MTAATLDALCPGCFTAIGEAATCPRCGQDDRAGASLILLPRGTLLHGQYVVGQVLGKPGGFGITYLGWDRHLETRVAIKEYLPRDLAGRAMDHVTVAAHSPDDAEIFSYGLEQFLREARTLAQLDHPNIVRVRQFFEANGTAYLVMDYYEGVTLAGHLERQGGRLPEDQAKALMLPILDGLRAVHAKGFLHRDIKPQNIYLARMEGGGARPILLDFGAARLAMGERSRSLSVVLTPGFAPFEQYHRKGNQGAWTDIYAAAAVLYRMVTGVTPPEATERMAGDEIQPATAYGVSPALSQALTEALALVPEARPQTVQTFQALLAGSRPGVGTTSPVKDARIQGSSGGIAEPAKVQAPRYGWRVFFLLLLTLGGSLAIVEYFKGSELSAFELTPEQTGALLASFCATSIIGGYLWRHRLCLGQAPTVYSLIFLGIYSGVAMGIAINASPWEDWGDIVAPLLFPGLLLAGILLSYLRLHRRTMRFSSLIPLFMALALAFISISLAVSVPFADKGNGMISTGNLYFLFYTYGPFISLALAAAVLVGIGALIRWDRRRAAKDASSGSSAPAWGQVTTLQRRDGVRAAGAAARHSHAGAWERDQAL